jgi:putative transposase
MKNVIRIGSKRKPKVTPEEMALTSNHKSRVELIQALIPIGLGAVAEELKHEVQELAGAKHNRQGGLPGHYRWGSQDGSIYLSDQKLRIRVPRVRDVTRNKEVALESYRLLQEPRAADEGVMRRILSGLSCRNYEGCAEAVPEEFGISSSTISRRFIKVSANKLRELMERDLSGYDFVAVFIDARVLRKMK